MTREEREDAIDIIQSILNKYEEGECLVTEMTIGDEDIEAFKMAIKALEQEPKTGHWIEKDGFDGDTYYDCSECGESWTTIEGTPWDNEFKYCPNCGAKMVETPESEDKV